MPSFFKLHNILLLLGLAVCLVNAAPTKNARKCVRRAGLPAPRAKSASPVNAAPKAAPKKHRRAVTPEQHLAIRNGHPSAKGSITLYHGTPTDFAEPAFGDGNSMGDFHFGKKAFYMTDTIKAAAQYACLSWCMAPEDEAIVIEYKWDGSNNIHEFTGLTDPNWKGYQAWVAADGKPANAEYAKIHTQDMVTGPMRSAGDIINGFYPDFWQYTLMSATAATSKLHRIAVHKVQCKEVPAVNPQ